MTAVVKAASLARYVGFAAAMGYDYVEVGGRWVRGEPSWEPVAASQGRCDLDTRLGVTGQVHEHRPTWLGRTRLDPRIGALPVLGSRKVYSSETAFLTAEPFRCLAVAGSGHGKTTLLETYALHFAARGINVLLIDGKGSHDDALKLEQKATQLGIPTRTWTDDPARANPVDLLDGLGVGQKVAVFHAAAGLAAPAQAVGSAVIYSLEREAAFEALALAGVRTLEEAVDILARPYPVDGPLRGLATPSVGGGSYGTMALRALTPAAHRLRGLTALRHAGGWSPEDHRGLGVIAADVASPAGRTVASAVIVRLRADLSSRSGRADVAPLVVMLDEAASLFPVVGQEIMALYQMGRSAAYFPWIALQDPAQVQDENFLQQIVTNTEATFVGQIANAGRMLLLLGGTIWRDEATIPGSLAGPNAGSSKRAQRAHTVDPVVIEGLPVWSWAIAADSSWRGGFVPPVGQ